jgi:hypothetical protein
MGLIVDQILYTKHLINGESLVIYPMRISKTIDEICKESDTIKDYKKQIKLHTKLSTETNQWEGNHQGYRINGDVYNSMGVNNKSITFLSSEIVYLTAGLLVHKSNIRSYEAIIEMHRHLTEKTNNWK